MAGEIGGMLGFAILLEIARRSQGEDRRLDQLARDERREARLPEADGEVDTCGHQIADAFTRHELDRELGIAFAKGAEPASQDQRQEEGINVDPEAAAHSTAYAGSKLHDAMLAFAVARRWPDVLANSLQPGWVPTKMGGAGAPDELDQAHLTQAWLAASDEPGAKVTGRYFFHLGSLAPNPQANSAALQDRLIAIGAELSGVPLAA